MPTKLSSKDEVTFRQWYKIQADKLGLNPDPDAREHRYDYRGAFKANKGPDETQHWPSEFKMEGHPRMIVNGVNTKTGKRVK